MENVPNVDTKIKLYGLLVDQLQKYNSILWQAPAALLAANILALAQKPFDNPKALLALGFFNGALIFALYKIVRAERFLIDAIRNAENDLRSDFSAYMPTFKEFWFPIGGPETLLGAMALLDLCLIGYAFQGALLTIAKYFFIAGILIQVVGSLGIGVNIWRDSRKGEFNTMIGPWTRRAFWLYMAGYLPLMIGTWMTP